ncbi:RagB/SusD family nutrient uptake outer membrane protein [uncultured Draconibacterium sp.]|uniref:RagB/SusD family nutrient uptake outer membrane protein n=1 Tax=uncultured Draconibacterium sp. TaxID=1573823 RepID=UPI0029C081CE|nr:RagB/SusD family nutrient uptake outer membrane protein [uncultured Draconibacterium sp.]
MKKLKYIVIAFVLAFMFSCEDYLETVPYSFTSPENFYTNAKEAEMALSGVYNILSGAGSTVSTYSRELMFVLNGGTDEMIVRKGFNNGTVAPWGNAGFSSDSKYIDTNWAYFYAGINRANYLIENLEGIDDFVGNRKVEVEAEAKLLRGFYHMILAMMHGGIPVYTTPIQDPSAERQSLEAVYTQVLSDFEFAYNNLPGKASVSSHVDKWTAAGLLAKVHTYLASAKNSGLQNFGLELNSFDWVDANSHYQQALTVTSDAVANSAYELIDNYGYLFKETTNSYQYKECLLTAEASSNSNMYVINSILNAFIPQGNKATKGGGYGWFRPLGELWNKYSELDARRHNNLTGSIPNSNAEVEVIDGVRYYNPTPVDSATTAKYCVGKYRYKDPTQKTAANWSSEICLPLLRYADVLLMHAEALFFTGNEIEARNTLTVVRERAVQKGEVVDALNTAYYKSDFVEELLDERSRELCFENWRRFDLARFNKYDEAIASLTIDAGYYNSTVPSLQQNWKPEKVWFPIPLPQIDLNSNLVQNPGY